MITTDTVVLLVYTLNLPSANTSVPFWNASRLPDTLANIDGQLLFQIQTLIDDDASLRLKNRCPVEANLKPVISPPASVTLESSGLMSTPALASPAGRPSAAGS